MRRAPVLALVLGLATAACGSAPSLERAPTYEDLVSARIERSSSQTTFSFRHNPADCACSPFEILVGLGAAEPEPDGQTRPVKPAWHRVELIGLDDNDPIVVRIRDYLARVEATGQPDRRHFAMEGRLDGRVGTCARGTAQLSFAPSALLEPDGPDAAPSTGD